MSFNIGKDILPHEYKGTIYNKGSVGRLEFIWGAFLFLFSVFMVRTVELSLQENKIRKNVGNTVEVEKRADIIDRNGILLATTVKESKAEIFINKRRIKKDDVDAVAELVHEINPVKYTLKDALDFVQSDKKRVIIKTNAEEDIVRKVNKENKKLDCFEVQYNFVRKYPQHNIFSHVVGFVGKDGGLEGIERQYNEYLSNNKEPLRLSLDARIQNIFHEQLVMAMDKYEAKGAMGMLMNATTGEMIAMVQVPDFDPNDINAYPDSVRKFNLMRESYEMGSVFKIFNTALAYENGLQDRIYDVDKYFYFSNKDKPIRDVDSFYRDIKKDKIPSKMSADNIMKYSCNVGSAKIALDLPKDVQQEMFDRLHFDKALNLEFGKTARTWMHTRWGRAERATAAFGQGITVTPMHLLLAVNAMTNGGYYMYPTWLKRDIGPVRVEQILDSKISAKLRDIMYLIAEETTGTRARIPGIKIGGKTGTAEKHVDGKTDKSKNLTVFAGVFPVDAPQYVILIMLDEPQRVEASSNQRTAAYNSVPTAGAILNSIMPLLFE